MLLHRPHVLVSLALVGKDKQGEILRLQSHVCVMDGPAIFVLVEILHLDGKTLQVLGFLHAEAEDISRVLGTVCSDIFDPAGMPVHGILANRGDFVFEAGS